MEGSDEPLVLRFQSGEREAFEALVRRYQPKVYGVICNMVRNEHLAQDITQEVFIKLYRFLPHFKGRAKFYTWFYRVAVNHTMTAMKRARRNGWMRQANPEEGGSDPIEMQGDTTLNPQKLLYDRELARCIDNAVGSLSETLRSTFVLREYEDLSYADLAKIFKCSRGTIKSRLSRAREELRQKLSPYLEQRTATGKGVH